ncbi:hypothetical protein, partial [Bradyrhizobium sp. CCBAU 11361]|uniref:hypothetical protein n=1 Tax=Bradyrhizobium sp. CCBAU 11361 TaxID=1630812 RepID=UPI0023026C7C
MGNSVEVEAILELERISSLTESQNCRPESAMDEAWTISREADMSGRGQDEREAICDVFGR